MALLRVGPAAFVLIAGLAPASAQLPPQAVKVLKPLADKLVEKLIKPKMQVESFTLGGFKATSVDPDSEATPERFAGSATFALPAPIGERKLDFKNLVLKGGVAEGTLDGPLKDFSAEHLGWKYYLTKVVLSDKGSRAEGHAVLAGLKLDVGPLTLSPKGLLGTLSPGDLPLAEGVFTATLLAGEVTFGLKNVSLKGNLEVVVAPPVLRGDTGQEIRLEGGSVVFDSALLGTGTGTVAPSLAANLVMRYKGQTWIIEQETFGFSRGTPVLGGPTKLRFPLNVFCHQGNTDQPYVTEALSCHMQAQIPSPSVPSSSGSKPMLSARKASIPAVGKAEAAWEGFSGSFVMPPAALLPSGLSAYHLDLTKGVVRIEKGLLDPAGTRITGSLTWGPSFTYKTSFTNAQASLDDGLLVKGSCPTYSTVAETGAYRVLALSDQVLDFSASASPEGLSEGWMGVYLSSFGITLPPDIFTLAPDHGDVGPPFRRAPVLVMGKGGRLEGNGTFSASLGVKLADPVTLYFSPIRLDPFDLNFFEGALLGGPVVTGKLDLTAPPLLEHFNPSVSFHMTQNGVEQVEVDTSTPQGSMGSKTCLVGITTVVDAARLYPTMLDMSGRFDFAIEGADIPSVTFDHLVLEASGVGIEGSKDPLSIEFKGERWSSLPDRPHISLWGFPFALAESGYGVKDDGDPEGGRFYVGLAGDIEANPLLAVLSNRLLFTTIKGTNDQPTIELTDPYTVKQDLASLGTLDGKMEFKVALAGDKVSEAYFKGDATMKLNVADTPFDLGAGLRFGRSFQGSSYFPYFYALGTLNVDGAGIPVGPDLEIHGLIGGLAQNFLPDEIRNTSNITGKADSSLGLGIMAGVNLGTIDQFSFDSELDLYVSQNLTTLLQGKGWLLAARGNNPTDRQVTADISFTRNPNVFQATLDADINLFNILHPVGRVELRFAPDSQYVHIGTQDAPISVTFLNQYEGWGYFTADFVNGDRRFGAGGGVTYTKGADFGIVYGNAWLTAQGDLVIDIDSNGDPSFYGAVGAEGGASFGMKFKTWKTYHITIFSGSIGANLALQVPGAPTFSGSVTVRYSVLGGLFHGSIGASLNL